MNPFPPLAHHPAGRSRVAAVVAALTLALTPLVAGCGSTPGGEDPATSTAGAKIATSLAVLIDRELAKPDLTPQVRQILERAKASGAISQADYESAFAVYAKCVKDAGVVEEYVKLPSGVYKVIPHYSTDSQAAAKADFDRSGDCGIANLAPIEGLYTLQVGNPDLLADNYQVATGCLIKAGLVKADFTSATLKTLAEKGFEGAPFDTGSTAFTQCLANAGMAFAGRT